MQFDLILPRIVEGGKELHVRVQLCGGSEENAPASDKPARRAPTRSQLKHRMRTRPLSHGLLGLLLIVLAAQPAHSLDLTWLPADPEGPLPLSQAYRDSLERLCVLVDGS